MLKMRWMISRRRMQSKYCVEQEQELLIDNAIQVAGRRWTFFAVQEELN